MTLDTNLPFRGSDAVRSGELTWGVLRGPGFRGLGRDTHVAAHVPDSALLQVRAALVRAGDGAVATGWSACVVNGLDVAPGRKPVELTVGDRRSRPRDGTLVHQQRLLDDEVDTVDGVRTTTALRTAFDLAVRSGPDRTAVDRVIEPLADAVAAADALARAGGFAATDLVAFAGRHPGARHVRRVSRVAALLDPLSDSPPESRARVQLVLAGLPRPVLQYEVHDAFGAFVARLDLAWPDRLVAVEYDGRDHARSDRRGRDLDRLDALRRAGWEVIVVTGRQVARRGWLAARVREALTARGWRSDGAGEWAGVVEENERLSFGPSAR